MASTGQTFGPPPVGTPLTDPAWTAFMQQLWDRTSRNGGAVGESLSVTGGQGNTTLTAAFTNENLYQMLLTLNCGLYSTYSSGNGNIIYGTIGFVNRIGGSALAVGGFFTGVAKRGVTCEVFGLASQAIADIGSLNCTLVGFEPSVANFDPSNISAKWGVNVVFKNRGDGVAATPAGLGANQYNYKAEGITFTSQPRSAVGEYCGFAVGIDFLSDALDLHIPRVWSSTVTYVSGDVVSSGGAAWKAIIQSLNQTPVLGSAYWVLMVPTTVFTGTAPAVGIDFSSLSLTTMSRMQAAIKLRSTLPIAWEESGQVSTFFDPTTARLVLVNNGTFRRLECDVTTGFLYRNGVFLI